MSANFNLDLPEFEELFRLYQLTSDQNLPGTSNIQPLFAFKDADPNPAGPDPAASPADGRNTVAARWLDIEQESAFIWLVKQPGFNKAWGVFQKKQTYKSAAAAMRSPLADFRFVNVLAWALVLFVTAKHSDANQLPDKSTAAKAARCAATLLLLDLRGLAPSPTLRIALQTLTRQTSSIRATRKRRDDANSDARDFLKTLITSFSLSFGESLSTCAQDLCSLVGYSVDRSAFKVQIKKHVASHRKQYTRALVEALRNRAT